MDKSIHCYNLGVVLSSVYASLQYAIFSKVAQEFNCGIFPLKMMQRISHISIVLADNICDAIFFTSISCICCAIALFAMNSTIDISRCMIFIILLIPAMISIVRCYALIFINNQSRLMMVGAVVFIPALPLLIFATDFAVGKFANTGIAATYAVFCLLMYSVASGVLLKCVDVVN